MPVTVRDAGAPGEGRSPGRPGACIERKLSSPLFAAMVHVAEMAGLIADADVVAGRLFHGPPGVPSAYIGSAGLSLTAEQRTDLHRACTADQPIFMQLQERGPGRAIVDIEPICRNTGHPPRHWLPAPLDELCRIDDAFALMMTLDAHCVCALLLLRQRGRRSFEAARRDALAARRPIMRNLLAEAGQRQQRPAEASWPAARPTGDPRARLSQTERKVLDRIEQDVTEREAARQMQRSPHTIHVHVKNIYRKLGVSSRGQLRELLRRSRR